MGITQADREAASFHLGFEIENPEDFHAVRRCRVFILNDSDVATKEAKIVKTQPRTMGTQRSPSGILSNPKMFRLM